MHPSSKYCYLPLRDAVKCVWSYTKRTLLPPESGCDLTWEGVTPQKTLTVSVIVIRTSNLSYSSDFTFYVLNLVGGERGQTRLTKSLSKAEVGDPVLHHLRIITVLAKYWVGEPAKLKHKRFLRVHSIVKIVTAVSSSFLAWLVIKYISLEK